jgi:hypothetical protein
VETFLMVRDAAQVKLHIVKGKCGR